jgi:hypothetical protein
VDLIPWNHWPNHLCDGADNGLLHGLPPRQEEHEGEKRNYVECQKDEGDKE